MGDSSEQDTKRGSQGTTGTLTIVGGRPDGRGKGTGGIPVGIQVLVKKAAVDEDFRTALLDTRAQAATRIGLELTPAEVATLGSVPREQLEKIIEHTKVPDEQRRVFLGQLGVAMVALLASVMPSFAEDADTSRGNGPFPRLTGSRPDPVTKGIRPDRPGKPLSPAGKPADSETEDGSKDRGK